MLHVQIKKQLRHFMLDISFHLDHEIAALFGPSGSGKTTILQCISGLEKIDEGTIKLHDRLLTKDNKLYVPVQKRRIGYLFQDYALFPHLTIRENIAYGMTEESFISELIEQLEMEHLLDNYPHEVSGGEKQRTALLRSLATKPQLLLLDEPFSALDEKTKRRSYEQIKEIHRNWNIPILFVTHQKEEINRLAATVYFIEKGRIVTRKSE